MVSVDMAGVDVLCNGQMLQLGVPQLGGCLSTWGGDGTWHGRLGAAETT